VFTFGVRIHLPVLHPGGKEAALFCKRAAALCDELDEKYKLLIFFAGGFSVDRYWLLGFNIIYDESDPIQWQKAKQAGEELQQKAYAWGAFPYRCGTYWNKELRQLGPYYDIIKKVKAMLDPNHIMAPGILGL
jgi:hypothetical protein